MKKTIMITDASFGIGKFASLYFAEKGWNVITAVRKLSDAEELMTNPSFLICEMDTADIVSIENAILDSIDEFGGIDVVLNNRKDKLNENVMNAILPHFRIRNKGMIIDVNVGAASLSANVYELANGNMIEQQYLPDETFIDFQGYLSSCFCFLLD